MTRILIRAPKSPFDAVPPEQVLSQNLIGDNSGNLLFIDSAWRLLSTRGTELTPDRFAPHLLDPDEVNERFDVYVIPFANAFRLPFESQLIRFTRLIERLKIPVVVVGVGFQGGLPYAAGATREIDGAAKAFVSAVLDRSSSIGVRGEYTHDYLRRLGFADVEVIGCPSMFLHGDRMAVTKRTPTLERDARIGLGVTNKVTAMGPIVAHHVERYPNLEYIAQDIDALRLLLWGEGPGAEAASSPLPIHRSHPLLRDDKSVFYVDPWPWVEAMREQDFVFGTRIHGSIAAVLAGTPGYLLAADARTHELARYFEIPHRVMSEVAPDVDAADLYAEADFSGLVGGHAARARTFFGYLERQGLRHVFQEGEDASAFDDRLAAVTFPDPVRARRVDPLLRTRRRATHLARRIRSTARTRLRPA
jgi:hypothetical protein